MLSDLTNRISLDSTETLGNDLDLPSPCNGSSCFKENININKAETSKLSVEPQQMKRKKQGGGYNLRKSLAWDRAFFTEEGVLDPLELSVISGASCSKGFPSINEKTPGDSKLPIKHVDLQKVESSLLKELQYEDIGKDRKKDWSSPKTSHKVPASARLGSRSGSRCSNLPRHLPSSSLKRPANVMVSKAAGKDLKLPKVPDSKPGPRPATTKSIILKANCVKHNQITRPGLTSSCRSIKETQNTSKLSSLPSACCSDGKLGNSPSKRLSSDNMIPDRPVNSSEGHHELRSSAAPFSQDTHVSCRATHTLQNQTMRPSGLRMPSPSLSFFAQPKPSVCCDLSMGDTKADACWSQKPGNTTLRDNLKRTSKADDKILESTICISKAISSRSGCIVPSHANAVELIKSNLNHNPMQKVEVQDLPKKSCIERISTEEAELQKVVKGPSQSGSHEQAISDNAFKEAINGYLVKSESVGSEWKNPDLKSGQNYAGHECETTVSSAGDRQKEKSTCNLLVLNHGFINGTQCEDALNHKVQNSLTVRSDWKETYKPDGHDPHRDQTDPYKYSIGENDMMTDEVKNVLEAKETTGLQRAGTKQMGCSCSESVSCEVLEHMQTEAEKSYFGPKHLCVDLSKQAIFTEVLTDDLLVGEAHIQNAVASTIRGTDIHNDTEQSVKDSAAQKICPKAVIESQRNVQFSTSDNLLPAKPICIRSSRQEKNVQKLLSVVSDRKVGNNVIVNKMESSLRPGKMLNCKLDADNLIGQLLIGTECGSVDSLSSKSHINSINTRFSYDEECKSNANISLYNPSNENLSNSLNQDSWRIESDYYSSFPESRTTDMSQIVTLSKVTEVEPNNYGSATKSTSNMPLIGSESDMDNLRNVCYSGAVLMQSPERSMSDDCCYHPAESALPSAKFAHGNAGLHFEYHPPRENRPDMPYEDNPLGSTEDSVSEEKKTSMLVSSNVSAEESTLEHEGCNDAEETGGYIADAITDPSRVAPVSDTTTSEFSGDISTFNGLPPKSDSDIVKVETASAPNNKKDDAYEKSHSFVPPHNVIPFSDEWLAAIEAAGEDILTRKGGAVQNSPPGKSLPEPSPWSPVKRKNNQIGPYDCTKYTNIAPSDSN